MTFGGAPRLRSSPRLTVLIPVVVAVVVVILLLTVGTSLYADLLFYREVGFSRVFSTVLGTRILLFVVAGVLAATVIGANVVLGYALRPTYVPMSPEQQQLERYRVGLQPYRRLLLILVAGFLGLLFASAAQKRWQTWQLWLHGQSFGTKDPQFHRDVSYYAFTLPFERMVLGYAFGALVVSILVAAAMHYLYGGIRVQTRGEKVSAAARAHLSVLLGLFVLLKAVAYYLDRFGLLFSPRGRVTGAGYADVHATLPSKTILLVIAVICAGLFFANAFRRGFALPAISFGLLVLSAIVIGGAYPAIVQQLKVKPNELNREAPYIGRNITATRNAYGIVPKDSTHPQGSVVTTNYDAGKAPSAASVTANTGTVPNARLLDPTKLKPTFEQLQQVRSYYGFPETLDVDRYTVGGREQSYVVAARELDLTGLQADQQNWPNEHLVYTHGQGFVAAQTSDVDANGRPVFTVKDIPTTGDKAISGPIPVQQPRIYYGEQSPRYSVVDTQQKEVDGPEPADYNYGGKGGVEAGGKLFRRLALAVHFRDYNLYFSSAVTSTSKVMYNRDPRQRVAKVAPWLTLDGDPYPAIIGGRVEWIVDGYTTSDQYPYSQRVSFGGATTDTTTVTSSNVSAQSGKINYIRNSVKATVDAYDGTVTLYAFERGQPDPVLRTWEQVFPGTVTPESKISPELMAHLRYPEDLFKVQRQLLTRYHVSDPRAFFTGGDFWDVPPDPAIKDTTTPQPAYYVQAQLPGQSTPEFNLITALNFRNRPNLAAFAAVSSDQQDYGTIRVLDLPSGAVINGPGNVENAIQSDATFGPVVTLLDQQGSKVVRGNLLTLPVGGSFLFVQPFYVEASSGQTFPTLKYVVVVYGDKVGFASTLQEAERQALSGGGGTGVAPGGTNSPSPSASPSGSPSGSVPPVSGGSVGALAERVASDANAVRAAQAGGDLGKISAAQQTYASDLAKLVAALDLPGSSTSRAPSPARPTPAPASSTKK